MAKLDGGAILEAADHPVTFLIAIALIWAPIMIGTILLLQYLGLLGPGLVG